jgi:hypothetical protein
MTAAWTIEDAAGQLRPEFTAATALEVGRRILPARYDAFRLHVSPSYRELFDRAVAKALAEQGWRIVRLTRRARRPAHGGDLPLAA